MSLKYKMRILYSIAIILFIIIAFYLFYSPFLIISELAFVILFLIIKTSIYQKATINVAKQFAFDCNPDDYINNINNTYYAKNKNAKFLKNIYTALGYSYKGNIDKALHILENTQTISVSSYNEYLYHSILSRIYLDNGNLKLGMKSFDIIKQINLNTKKQQMSKNYTLQIRKSQILFLKNQFDKSLEIENKIKAFSNLENVLKNYRLALIYTKLNRTNDAIKHLQFVVENGNKLHLVTIAKQKLEVLQNEM